MHDTTEFRRLGLIMAAGFAATFGVLYWRDHRDAAPALPSPQATADARPRSAAQTPMREVAAPLPAATSASIEPGSRPAAPATVPAPEEASPPAPPVLHVFVNRMRDTERRRIRIANTGAEPIDCLVRVLRNGSMIGERQIELRFNKEVTLGVEDDLEVHAGDKIVVQSSLGPQLAEVEVS